MPQAQHCWEWQRKEGTCSNICRIRIRSCHKAAERWKKSIHRHFYRSRLCAALGPAVSSVFLWLMTAIHTACLPGVCPFIVAGLCAGQQEGAQAQALAHRGWLLKAGAETPTLLLLGDSQSTQVTFCSWTYCPGIEAWSKCGKPTTKCLQMLLSWSPFLPHFSTLPIILPDVADGVTLLPQCYGYFRDCLSHPSIWPKLPFSNATLHLL